ncbi:hypothetical protein B0H13DRAFT_2015103 [Mycena leptocephala]|nr:hypothetical protein B0H13DRAFT_2015103 [Mycena leptocephala]
MAASSLPVQEIWDEVLDYLHDARKDLLFSALVCRSFVARAQRHLFHSIVIASNRHQTTIAATELAEILSSSPHLIDYICDLYIGECDLETLTPIVQVAWSRLRTISLVHDDEGRTLALNLICTLVSLPALRHISFHGNMWESNQLHIVLASCNPSVFSLVFRACSPEIPNPDDARILVPRNGPRPRITELELFFADNIPDFLMDAACPLDLSGLVHVKFRWSTGAGLYPFLYSFGHTIQSLDIDAADHGVETLDLGSIPALTHLSLRGMGNALQWTMERSRPSNVRTICYCLASWTGTTGLKAVEPWILAAKMPALQRVDVKVIFDQYNKFSRTQWSTLIEDSMPQLVKRGILAIQFS